jgi:hypothetical protein
MGSHLGITTIVVVSAVPSSSPSQPSWVSFYDYLIKRKRFCKEEVNNFQYHSVF